MLVSRGILEPLDTFLACAKSCLDVLHQDGNAIHMRDADETTSIVLGKASQWLTASVTHLSIAERGWL